MSVRGLVAANIAVLKLVLPYLVRQAHEEAYHCLSSHCCWHISLLPPRLHLSVQVPSSWCVYTAYERVRRLPAATSRQALKKSQQALSWVATYQVPAYQVSFILPVVLCSTKPMLLCPYWCHCLYYRTTSTDTPAGHAASSHPAWVTSTTWARACLLNPALTSRGFLGRTVVKSQAFRNRVIGKGTVFPVKLVTLCCRHHQYMYTYSVL